MCSAHRSHGNILNCFFNFLACALFGLCLLIFCQQAKGQTSGATLNGTVTDATGSSIPNVKVSIKDVATGIVREATTDGNGIYLAPNLAPGQYQVTATAQGFSTQVRSGITLTVGAQQVLNLTMQVGAVSQQVEVTSEAPSVQLETAALSGEVNEKTVTDLPLNGRDWTSLATLQPGVLSLASAQNAFLGNNRVNKGFGNQVTITGANPYQNNYRVDGITVNDYNNGGPGNATGTSVGVDAIQEFSVITSNYSAEYGRTSGGVINAITRSGTNQFHGSAFDFLRNSALDARNFFDAPQIPAFRRNQFGASAGGPIIKNKTFIFGDYEGLRQSLGSTNLVNVPSPDALNGTIHNANGTTTTLIVSPIVQQFNAAVFHPYNDGLIAPGNTGIYSFVADQVTSDNYVTTRVDHHFSDKDSLFGTFLREHSQLVQPDALNDVLVQQNTANDRFALEETHIFSAAFVNSARFGFNRVHNIGGGGVAVLSPGIENPAFIAYTGYDAPGISVPGLTAFSGGEKTQPTNNYAWNSFQGYDDASITVGKHIIKFGGGVERDQENVRQSTSAGGSFTYGSLNAYLTNASPTRFLYLSLIPTDHWRVTAFSGYIQDDIRWRPNLTINVGLRYEMMRDPTEVNNKYAYLPSDTATAPVTGFPLFKNPTLRNFAPRIGFAWDPFRDGKTSIRAGFGQFDRLPFPYQWQFNEDNSYPNTFNLQSATLPAGVFPGGAAALTTGLASLRVDGINIDGPPKRDYVLQWNLSVERQLMPNLTLMVAYVGSHGVHGMNDEYDRDMVLPTVTPAGYLWPKPTINAAGTYVYTGTKINPNWGHVDFADWDQTSSFDALEAQVTRRLSRGFQIQGSFTWGRSTDTSSGYGLPNPFNNSINNLFYFENNVNRSLSDFNVKDNLVINSIWQAPKPHFGNREVNWALGGWQLVGIFNARTGQPMTVLIGGDPLGTLDAGPFDFPNRVTTGAGCDTAVNKGSVNYINLSCFTLPMATPAIAALCTPFKSATVAGTCVNLQGNETRNSLIGPGLVDLDFSMIKNNYIGHSERFNAQFRAEFFNIMNFHNFNSPTDNQTLFDTNGAPVGAAGNIDSTSTTSRQIQVALKLIW